MSNGREMPQTAVHAGHIVSGYRQRFRTVVQGQLQVMDIALGLHHLGHIGHKRTMAANEGGTGKSTLQFFQGRANQLFPQLSCFEVMHRHIIILALQEK